MLTVAQDKDLVVRLLRKPGDFVARARWSPWFGPPRRVDAQLDKQIRGAFQIGNRRTPTQDIEYAVNQLVEMAVRAMSPAINDPFTAMTCLDYLGDGLALFIRQGEKARTTMIGHGRLRARPGTGHLRRTARRAPLICSAMPAVTMPVSCCTCCE